MTLLINSVAPNFTANTTHGTIDFHEWIGDSWSVFFSHPKDFTPVCTTELGEVAKLSEQFKKHNAKPIALSIDSVADHYEWIKDIEQTQNTTVNYPIIGDTDLSIAHLYDMLPAEETGASATRTAVNNLTVRSVFIIDPNKKIRLILTYPMTTGRNFDEIIRVLHSIQLTEKHKVATPANWQQGEDVIIVPAVSNEDANTLFPGYKTIKPYLRTTKQPSL